MTAIFLTFLLTLIPPTPGEPNDSIDAGSDMSDNFTFTEAQLSEDDESQEVTIINSNNNVYTNGLGFLFSAARFRYRALDTRRNKYNEVFINGAPMNDAERGGFTFAIVGGLNQQTKNVEFTLPFEICNYTVSDAAGSNNYNFRPASMAEGERLSLLIRNSNYTVRPMWTFNSGLNDKGWAVSANITYRWSDMNTANIDGTYYNALSYFLGAEKIIAGGEHTLSLVTWGTPREYAQQGGSTDEMYWIAGDRHYNRNWGYQAGRKRNSRVVNDYAPVLLATWDWNISQEEKLTASIAGKYSMYAKTRLAYNGSGRSPMPDYYSKMPSAFYDVWDENDSYNRTEYNLANWNAAYDYLTASENNRQIQWDMLYSANRSASEQGTEAIYYMPQQHNNQLSLILSSVYSLTTRKDLKWNIGLNGSTNKGYHYNTMYDLLGATVFHNINNYVTSTYSLSSNEVQYDMNNPGAAVAVGDKFQYDYNILVDNARAWTSLSGKKGYMRFGAALKTGATEMQRCGKMRNGLAPDNSYGKSGTARFLDGGGKVMINIDTKKGHGITAGAGYEWRAPLAGVAFAAPEINNDFVENLDNERVFSSEIGYSFQNGVVNANIQAYYYYMWNVTDWQNFYDDDANSFSYVSLTDMEKMYSGVEAGVNIKLSSAYNLKMRGAWSEAKNTANSNVRYMKSKDALYYNDIVYDKNMRESGTPLTAANITLSYHQHGWYIDIMTNWYDRIFLSYAPSYRYGETLKNRQSVYGDVYDDNGKLNSQAVSQAKGHGGWTAEAMIGKSLYLKKGMLSINISVSNILNNNNICTGGYESSRADYTASGNSRTYKFSKNPVKFYTYGTSGMLNIGWRFQ